VNRGWLFWRNTSPSTNFASNAPLQNGTESVETLVRELIQNSADAQRDKNAPVKIEVSLDTVQAADAEQYLGLDDLKKHIQGTLDLAAHVTSSYQQVTQRVENKLNYLNQTSSFRCLKFSDYNTKGLSGVELSGDVLNTNSGAAFWTLLFGQGYGQKEENSAGGAGVGKNAVFPFSKINTVLYSTKTDKGFGIAGTAQLEDSLENGKRYQSTGHFLTYVGDKEEIFSEEEKGYKNFKAIDFDALPACFDTLLKRSEIGTDVIIFGLNEDLQNTWDYDFAVYAIKNFYVAFMEKNVQMTIHRSNGNDFVINNQTLLDDVETLKKEISSESRNNYNSDYEELSEALSEASSYIKTYMSHQSNEPGANDYKVIETDEFSELGHIKLYLKRYSDSDEDGSSKSGCYIVRSFGMSTCYINANADRPTIGIIRITDPTGSRFLLDAEEPSHTAFSKTNLDEIHKKVINNLKKWVRKQISQFGEISSSETDLELSGLTNYIALEDAVQESEKGKLRVEPVVYINESEKKVQKPKKTRRKRMRTGGTDKRSNGGGSILPGGDVFVPANLDHNGGSHREHPKTIVATEGTSGNKTSYTRTIRVNSVIRNLQDPGSNIVDVIGTISSSSFHNIDITVRAVDSENRVNSNIPYIDSAIDIPTGKPLELGNHYMVKNVPVIAGANANVFRIRLKFLSPFRSVLAFEASVTRTISTALTTGDESSTGSSVNESEPLNGKIEAAANHLED